MQNLPPKIFKTTNFDRFYRQGTNDALRMCSNYAMHDVFIVVSTYEAVNSSGHRGLAILGTK